MWIYDIDTSEILKVNRAALEQYEYTKQGFLSLSIKDLNLKQAVPYSFQRKASIPARYGDVTIWKHQSKSGRKFYVEILSQSLEYNDRKVNLVQAREITSPTEEDEYILHKQKELAYHLSNSPLGIIEWDDQYRIKKITQRITEMLGYTSVDLIGRGVRELVETLVLEADRNKAFKTVENIKEGDVTREKVELRIIAKDGSVRYTQWYKSVLRDRKNAIVSVFSLIDDLTEQKELEQSRDRMFDMIKATPDLIGMVDRKGKVQYLNRAGKKMLEIDENDDIREYRLEDFHPKKGIQQLKKQIFPTVQQEKVWKGEINFKSQLTGEAIPTSSVIVCHSDSEGKVEYYSAISRNISDELKQRKALVEKNNRLSLAMESGQIGFWDYYPQKETEVLDAGSRWMAEVLGYSEKELRKKEIFGLSLIHPSDREQAMDKFNKLLSGKDDFYQAELRLRKADGSWCWVLSRAMVVKRDQRGAPLQVSGVHMDIDDKKRAEIQLLREYQNQEVVKDIALIVNGDKSMDEAMQDCLARISGFLDCQVGHIFNNSSNLYSSGLWHFDKQYQDTFSSFKEATERVRCQSEEGLVGKLALTPKIHWFDLERDESNFKRSEVAQNAGIQSGVLLSVTVKGKIKAVLEFYSQKEITQSQQLRKTLDTIRNLIGRLLERKQYLVSIEEEKQKYQLLAQNSTDMISRHKPDGTYRYVSSSAKSLLGYEPGELIGTHGYKYVHPEDLQTVKESHQKILNSSQTNTVAYRFETKSGGYRWVETTTRTIREAESGDIIEIQSATRDISERKKYEHELKQERDFISTAIESLPGLFYMIDEDQNYVLWNKNLEDKFGYSASEIKQMHPLDFYREEDYELITSKIQQAFEEGEAEVEIDIHDKQGRPARYYITGRKLETEDKTYIVGSGIDISERVEVQRKLRLHDQLLSELFENAPIGLVRLDKEDNIISANESFENIFNYKRAEIEGHNINDLITPEGLEIDQLEVISKQHKSHNDTFQYESVRIDRDGKEIPVLIGAVPVFIDSELVANYTMYVDITNRKEFEKEIKRTLREKQILIQEIHHRVKNNLAVISGLLQMKSFSTGNPEIKKALSESQRRIKSMALIHEKLYQQESLSSIEFNRYMNDLGQSIKKMVDLQDKVELTIDCIPLELNVNQAVPTALIINELLSNAFEHAFHDMDDGHIVTKVRKKKDIITITVKDNGIGLPSDFNMQEIQTLGFTIIRTLLEQLSADFRIKDDNGTAFAFIFKKKEIKGSSSTILG